MIRTDRCTFMSPKMTTFHEKKTDLGRHFSHFCDILGREQLICWKEMLIETIKNIFLRSILDCFLQSRKVTGIWEPVMPVIVITHLFQAAGVTCGGENVP